MKKLIIIILFINGHQVFSQDIRLFENTYYLHDLVIDGISNVPPINNEIPFIPAEFFENGLLITGMCEEGGSGDLEYFGTTEFEILNIAFFAGGCSGNKPYNQQYSGLYQNFWFVLFDQDIVSYEIIDNGQSRTLIITGENNDYAIYKNEFLSVDDFKNLEFSIFPNPVEDIVYIKNKKNTNLSKIRILDLNGRLIQLTEQIDLDNLTVNVEKLNKGIYFISLENESNQKAFKKFIKK